MSSSAWKKSNHHYHLVSGWAAEGEFSRGEKIGVILAIFHFQKFTLFSFCWCFGVCVQIWLAKFETRPGWRTRWGRTSYKYGSHNSTYSNHVTPFLTIVRAQPWMACLKRSLRIDPIITGGILNPIFGYFWGWVFPFISRIHTAYITVRIPPF